MKIFIDLYCHKDFITHKFVIIENVRGIIESWGKEGKFGRKANVQSMFVWLILSIIDTNLNL
jgi:hypothetical protein